jgi:hypothetical protein
MRSVYDVLYAWARRTTTSFAELINTGFDREESVPPEDDELIYRLKEWPQLPYSQKTADIYRALSVMSHRPVNRHWLITHAGLRHDQLDRLLQRLIADGAVEVIDSSKFSGN